MAVVGATLTSAQETNLLSRMDQDDDFWMVLFAIYLRSRGDQIEDLKTRCINGTAEWTDDLKKNREQGYGDIKQLVTEKTLQWTIRIKQYLGDPGLLNLLKIYLRSLAGSRTKRASGSDTTSNARKQINTILSQLADSISLTLDPYQDMTHCLEHNQTPGGKDLTDVSRNYYQMRQSEYFNLISTYLAMVISLKIAATNEDIMRCKEMARRNLVKPL